MTVLALIPARGGSKRVPKKNIRSLCGKPLIAYTIEAALAVKQIDRVIVSTDDDEIAKIAREHGASTPFMRPTELAADATPDQPVLRHALDWLKTHENYVPDCVLHLRPTTPFKTSEIIEAVIRRMAEGKVDVVRTMSRVNGVHHPYWMYRIGKDEKVEPFVEGIKVGDYYQSQLLPPAYRINGVVDAIRTRAVYEESFLDSHNMAAVIIPEEAAMDIDTELEFKLCELLLADSNRR